MYTHSAVHTAVPLWANTWHSGLEAPLVGQPVLSMAVVVAVVVVVVAVIVVIVVVE
jgi:hypothetical protein